MRTRRVLTSRARRGGLTFVELIMGLAGLVIIGLAIGASLSAAGYSSQSGADIRSIAVKHKTLLIRVGDAIRQSAMVLDQGDDFLVLWMEDTDGNGNPNLAEVLRIDRDAGFNALRRYEAPDDLDPANNTEYDLATTDFDAATSAIKGAGEFPGQTWGTGLETLVFTTDDADPRNVRLISFRMGIRVGKMTDTIVGGAALR